MPKTLTPSNCRTVVCDGCGGKLKQRGTSQMSFAKRDINLPGVDLVREEMLSNRTLCWVCINDAIARLIFN